MKKNVSAPPSNTGGKKPPALTNEYLFQLITEQGKQITDIRKVISGHGQDIREIQEEYPLDPCMADDIQKEVKRKGVEVMGGKKSGAYKDKSIRTRVYQDIYTELKRQYGLVDENGSQQSYKRLKKKFFQGALNCIAGYELPIALANDVVAANEAEELEDED